MHRQDGSLSNRSIPQHHVFSFFQCHDRSDFFYDTSKHFSLRRAGPPRVGDQEANDGLVHKVDAPEKAARSYSRHGQVIAGYTLAAQNLEIGFFL